METPKCRPKCFVEYPSTKDSNGFIKCLGEGSEEQSPNLIRSRCLVQSEFFQDASDTPGADGKRGGHARQHRKESMFCHLGRKNILRTPGFHKQVSLGLKGPDTLAFIIFQGREEGWGMKSSFHYRPPFLRRLGQSFHLELQLLHVFLFLLVKNLIT